MFDRLGQNLLTQRPPLLVGGIELRRNRVGLCGVAGGQQLHGHAGITQAARRVQAGREGEPDVPGRDIAGHPRHFDERRQSQAG